MWTSWLSTAPRGWMEEGPTAATLSYAGVDVEALTFRHVASRLSRELRRARRYSRPLSLVLVGLDDVDAERSATSFETRRPRAVPPLLPFVSAVLAPVLRESVRDTDIVGYLAADARCVVGMPETSGEEARLAMRRVQGVEDDRVLPTLRVGVATFPDDGWTLEELLRHATEEFVGERPGVADAIRDEPA